MNQSQTRSLLLLLALAFLPPGHAVPADPARPPVEDAAAPQAVPVQDLVAKLKADADRSPPERVVELAKLRTREAMQGLLEVYDSMQTIFMKREVVRALPEFDGVSDAEQPALQKLMDVATGSDEPELRDAALDGLKRCRNHGKDFLRLIVVSEAEDSVREKAMKLHAGMASKEDIAWYRELALPKVDEKAEKEREKAEREARRKAEKEAREKEKQKQKGKGGKGDEVEEAPQPRRLVGIEPIRLICFKAIASTLTVDELLKTKKDKSAKIRRAALEELAARGDKKASEYAEAVFKDDAELPETRVVAARVIAQIEGTKAAPEFFKRATNNTSPVELRRGLAEILVGFGDEGVNKDLINGLVSGKGVGERQFQVYAVRAMKDERVDKALVKLLGDKEKEIVIAAAKILGERKCQEAIPVLKKLWETSKDREIVRAGFTATAMIRQGEATWIDELVALTKSPDPELRSLAIDGLGNVADKAHLDKLVAALDDTNWSTRLSALESLERIRVKAAIAPMIQRMAKEEGRMRSEFANVLWRLTGQPYADNAEGWANWWKENGERFQLLSDADLEKVKSGEEEWRLRQTTRVETKFFGIRIISHRVIFIVDVSGSMNEGLVNDYRGSAGKNRMEVAKGELAKCIKGLDPGALFNIYAFSSGVDTWLDGSLAAANEQNRESALTFVEKLGALGGTNLYGALKAAFEDPDVDTIFVLSDGEPSEGDVTDPMMIREHVRAWNQHRHVQLNTIAIGGRFRVLEWLAGDSNGTYVEFE